MIVIGLTGSIASGKSEAAKRFAHHGIAVLDADEAVHSLYRTQAVVDAIEARFPGTTLNGKVDRARLADHLVAAPEDFVALEALVHPQVRALMLAFLKRHEDEGAGLVILDVPLLLESGAESLVDRIVLITVASDIQRDRALKRPGMTPAKLDAILARQLPTSRKMASADVVVENSGSIDELAAKIDQIVHDVQAAEKGQSI
jgi:dephospho-CoA kinase